MNINRYKRAPGLLRTILFACLILSCGERSLTAGIIVDVQDAVLTAGGTGFVDVLVRTDGPAHSLALFNYDFEIIDPGGNLAPLKFLPQSNTDFTSNSNPDYIFKDNSVAFGAPLSDFNFKGGDSNLDNVPDLIDIELTTENRLLVRLDVEHVLPGGVDPALAAGDSFSIVPIFGPDFFFEDSGFSGSATINETLSSGGNVSFSFSAVPEPSCVLPLAALTTICGMRRRRRDSI